MMASQQQQPQVDGEIEQQSDSSDQTRIDEHFLLSEMGRSRGMASELSQHPSPVVTIYRAPQKLREGSEQYYTPRLVSIGPFHYGNEKYAAMDAIKLKSLHLVLQQSSQPLKFYVDKISDYADTARCYYSEKFVGKLQSNDDFAMMMLVDGAFIIKFMIDFALSRNIHTYDLVDPESHILLRWSAQEVSDIKHDLCLLENQLPFRFLESLNKMFFNNHKSQSSKFIWDADLTSLAVEIWPPIWGARKRYPSHFLDLLREAYLPHLKEVKEENLIYLKYRSIKSAKKLHEAGVKIKSTIKRYSEEYASFKEDGKLLIVPLKIDDTSLGLYKNIMALEQCCYPNAQHVSDYLILMEMLSRDGSEDLLVKKGVIVNNLTTYGATASSVLRDLCNNITYSSVWVASAGMSTTTAIVVPVESGHFCMARPGKLVVQL